MENGKIIKLLESTTFTAHKGDSWKYPENSYGAITSAFANKDADGVEFDVKMTKDKQLIIRHDETMMLTSSSLRNVHDLTLDELKKISIVAHKFDYYKHLVEVLMAKKEEYGKRQLELLEDLRGKQDKIITLEELLQLAPKDKQLFLEVKGSDEFYKSDIYSKSIAELVNEYSDKNIYIHGGNPKMMLTLSSLVNKPVGIGISKDINNIDLPLYHLCLEMGRIKKQLNRVIEAIINKQKTEVYFWKVETKWEMELYKLFLEEMAKYDLDVTHGIMSNDVLSAKILFKKEIDKLKTKRDL